MLSYAHIYVILLVLCLPLQDSASGQSYRNKQASERSSYGTRNRYLYHNRRYPTSAAQKRKTKGQNARTSSSGGSSSTPSPPLTSNQLTQYILQRLLSTASEGSAEPDGYSHDEIEEKIFASVAAASSPVQSSVVYPQDQVPPIRRYLDEAKEQLDVIDFTQPHDDSLSEASRNRHPRVDDTARSDDIDFGDDGDSRRSSSEQIQVRLAFPGTQQPSLPNQSVGCTNCVDGDAGRAASNRWTMPLHRLGDKQYYLGIFFKANWYKAEQYCRFHGMHLASINSADEQKDLQDHIQAYGMGHEHFWTSGTDQGEEGKFFWMSTGRPVTFENWNAGEPNNFQYEDGEQEHCLEMWDRDGKGMKWNDTPCSFSTFFICEA